MRERFLAWRRAVLLSLAVAGALAGVAWFLWPASQSDDVSRQSSRKLLLAPMMDLDGCLLAHRGLLSYSPLPVDARRRCLEEGGSVGLVEATMAPFQDGRDFQWGYTLKLPLLQLYERDEAGRWALDERALAHVAKTIATSRRPVVLYLFSNHFSAHTPLEEELAREPDNLARLAEGVLEPEVYHGAPLYPWSVAKVDNRLSQMRATAIDGVVRHLCHLTDAQRAPLVAVTLLGETHHLFPGFEQGMAFDAPYRLADYSPASLRGFSDWLAARFSHVGALNRYLGGVHHSTFSDVLPPGLAPPAAGSENAWGPFAHGWMPVSGWVHAGPTDGEQPARVRIMVNGQQVVEMVADRSRQDVLAALPALGRAEVGFQALLDYRDWPAGTHRVEVYWVPRKGSQTPVLLGRRDVQVVTAEGRRVPPGNSAFLQAPTAHEQAGSPPGGRAWLDNPVAGTVLRYDPLVGLWHTYRAQQVVDYIGYFARRLEGTCLRDVPRYTHQIFPHANPGWDVTRFAVDASLNPPLPLRLGVSLYGEAAFGESFSKEPGRAAKTLYAVTEFHPLRAMSERELSQTLRRHHDDGAVFVSFFLETRWKGERVRPPQNPYAFEPDNPLFGSDQLYRAAQALSK